MVEAPHGVVRGAGPTRSNTGETRPGRTRPAPRTVVRGPAPHGLSGGGPSRSRTGRTLAVVQGPKPGAVVSGRKPPRSHTARAPRGGAPSEPRTGRAQSEPGTVVHGPNSAQVAHGPPRTGRPPGPTLSVVRGPNPARSCAVRTPRGSCTGADPRGRTRAEPAQVMHGGGPPRSYAGRSPGRGLSVVRGAARSVLPRPARSCPARSWPGPSPVRVVRDPNLVRSVPVGGRPGRIPAGPIRSYAARPRTVVRGRGPARSYVAGTRMVVREAAGTRARRGPRQARPGTARDRPGRTRTYPWRHTPGGPGADPG